MILAPLGVALAFGLSAPAPSTAAKPPDVFVFFNGCTDTQVAEIRRLAVLELGAPLAGPEDPVAVRSEVRCEGALVRLTIRDPGNGKSLERAVTVPPNDLGGQPRLVALALAELITASGSQRASPPSPPPPAPAATNAGATTPVSGNPPEASRVELSAAGLGRHFFLSPGMLWGGGLGLTYQHTPTLMAGIDISGEHQQTPGAVARVVIDDVSLGLSEQWGTQLGFLVLRIGLAVRVGIATVTGHPNDATYASASTTDPWLGAALLSSLSVAQPHVFARLSLELGTTLIPAQALIANQTIGLTGPWLGLVLGVGLSP